MPVATATTSAGKLFNPSSATTMEIWGTHSLLIQPVPWLYCRMTISMSEFTLYSIYSVSFLNSGQRFRIR